MKKELMLSIIQKRWVMLCLFVMMCIFARLLLLGCVSNHKQTLQ